jgi:glyceraldehyde-3-phosphate dehydrogenase/erythrose-4-phosphate dehydrogenase
MVPLVIKDLKVHKVKLETRDLLVFLVNKENVESQVQWDYKVNVVPQVNLVNLVHWVHKEFKDSKENVD